MNATARRTALFVFMLALLLSACLKEMEFSTGNQLTEPAALPTARTPPSPPAPVSSTAPPAVACPDPDPTPKDTALMYIGKSEVCDGLVQISFGEGFTSQAWIARAGVPDDIYQNLPEAEVTP